MIMSDDEETSNAQLLKSMKSSLKKGKKKKARAKVL